MCSAPGPARNKSHVFWSCTPGALQDDGQRPTALEGVSVCLAQVTGGRWRQAAC